MNWFKYTLIKIAYFLGYMKGESQALSEMFKENARRNRG